MKLYPVDWHLNLFNFPVVLAEILRLTLFYYWFILFNKHLCFIDLPKFGSYTIINNYITFTLFC